MEKIDTFKVSAGPSPEIVFVCEHKYEIVDVVYKMEYGTYQNLYIRTATFFCNKCLEEREIKREEHSREMPLWFKLKKE